MKNYKWVIFDADNTLFDFNDFLGLKLLFKRFNLEFNNHHFDEYKKINNSLWVSYQNGTITMKEINRRFSPWLSKLKTPTPEEFNNSFLDTMGEISVPLAGAANLLNTLKDRVKLGMITNGYINMQHIRLKRNGFTQHFAFIVASEEVGVAKPNRKIFDYALSKMDHGTAPEQILMVGDTLESDILGGINAGIDTCWINSTNKPNTPHIIPTYQVASLSELENLFLTA